MALRKSFCFLMFFVMLICFTHARTFEVGGKDGWTTHPSENYNSWAGRLRFLINDKLHFKYDGGVDSVLVVNKGDYEGCNINNPIMKLDGGDSTFKFDRSGPFYSISGNKSNCDQGEKLIVVVLALRNRSPPPGPATPPSPTATPPSPAMTPPPGTFTLLSPVETPSSPAMTPPSTAVSPNLPPSPTTISHVPHSPESSVSPFPISSPQESHVSHVLSPSRTPTLTPLGNDPALTPLGSSLGGGGPIGGPGSATGEKLIVEILALNQSDGTGGAATGGAATGGAATGGVAMCIQGGGEATISSGSGANGSVKAAKNPLAGGNAVSLFAPTEPLSGTGGNATGGVTTGGYATGGVVICIQIGVVNGLNGSKASGSGGVVIQSPRGGNLASFVTMIFGLWLLN